MGDKIEAKRTALRPAFPTSPARMAASAPTAEAIEIADEIGYPVLVKATAGGGGKGMKVAQSGRAGRGPATARIRSQGVLQRRRVYLENISQPRHIEIQVLGDGQGDAIHLGERDCSLQRRHQKVLEEAPSPALNAVSATRSAGSRRAMREAQLRGAGTIEFLYEDGQFYFIEMNTRLQVEHPVTEMITGIDLVASRSASRPASRCRSRRTSALLGHAIEFRSMPKTRDLRAFAGRITDFHAPGGLGVRVDSALYRLQDPALLRQPGRQADRARPHPHRSGCGSARTGRIFIGGIETTIPLFRRWSPRPTPQRRYDIHWLEEFLKTEPPMDD